MTDGEVYFGVSKETYRMWKALAGNAKARRRWRRRNVPNMQREKANARAEWSAALDAKAEHFGDWSNGATWAPGIWAGAEQPLNAGVTLTLGDRAVEVTGQTNEEIAETVVRMINGAVLP